MSQPTSVLLPHLAAEGPWSAVFKGARSGGRSASRSCPAARVERRRGVGFASERSGHSAALPSIHQPLTAAAPRQPFVVKPLTEREPTLRVLIYESYVTSGRPNCGCLDGSARGCRIQGLAGPYWRSVIHDDAEIVSRVLRGQLASSQPASSSAPKRAPAVRPSVRPGNSTLVPSVVSTEARRE